MRVRGRVKWFDAGKGEGCAVSEAGSQAVLPAAMLAPFGCDAVKAGTALSYEMKLADGGLRVTEIYEIAGKAPGRGRADELAARIRALKARQGAQQTAPAAKWFSPAKGFGFIVTKTASRGQA